MKTTTHLLVFLAAVILFLASPPLFGQNQQEHLIAPGDTVIVKVFQQPDLDTTAVVRKDGTIEIELAGNTNISGKNVSEAANVIEAAYRDGYLVNPRVTVALGAIVKKRFSIQGQVVKPGPYFFPDGEEVSLLQAIGYAGGPTRIARMAGVTVLRKGTTIKVNAAKMAKEGGEPFFLQPGDVVNIPEGW